MRFVFTILLSMLSWQAMAEVQQFTLDNGMKIIVKEDHRAPVAVTMLWYNVGSADEPGGLTGVSHALEHMMFKGTSDWPLGAFSKKIAAIGGQENAMTNYDYTAYYEKIAASQLPVSLELEADRMQNLLLNKDEFAKEIEVIKEERRMRTDNNPQSLTLERYLATAHLSDPYHHPIIGWMSDLQQMSIEDVKAWYQSFYAPNNATLVVVGDVNPDNVHELARLYFSPIGKRPQFVRKKQTEPPAMGAKSVQVHAPAAMPLMMFGYTVPSVKTAQKEWEPYALEVIAGILDAGDSSRFASNLVRGRELASSADLYYNLYSRYQTQFIFYGSPARFHSLAQFKEGVLGEIKKLQQTPVKEAELKRIKLQIIAQKTFEEDSIFGQAMELGLLETVGLGWQTADKYQERIDAITPEQIQDVAKRYFTENALTEASLIPIAQPEVKQ
ncbi:M16 family metallopeptidase [Legionella sp. CNM-4043-24]|uniref:M16 family metallopeptidase n=1 Tax=Legionella sp. CNM-4043-24 TaxID=3421646 RepID=UPI00403B14C6